MMTTQNIIDERSMPVMAKKSMICDTGFEKSGLTETLGGESAGGY
jgi:hypothetical protein